MTLPRELADGLRLRHATAADTEALVAFNRDIHSEEDSIAVREMLDPTHPRMGPQDFLIIEDPQADNCIVSSACLIPETWAYDGIPFEIGMPEFVGTDPAYRQRGLMRTIMHALHQLSDERGCAAQIIHGVPWFYRRFGYEYALTFWAAYGMPVAQVPPVGDGGEEVHVRLATADDAALMRQLHAHNKAVVATNLSEDEWRYRLANTSDGAYTNRYFVVYGRDGRPAGYYRTWPKLRGSRLGVSVLVLNDLLPASDTLPAIARAVLAQGTRYAAEEGASFDSILFCLPSDHAAHLVFRNRLVVGSTQPLYVRVPNVAGFTRQIAPALERRLSQSAMHGFTGDVRINFYQDGLRLVFEQGRLTVAESITGHVGYGARYDAAFPPLVFLKLLFCHRSLDELQAMYPDCFATGMATPLLHALFPKQDAPIPF